jgi:CubicO group peptidase (beta-lactamase class C family)
VPKLDFSAFDAAVSTFLSDKGLSGAGGVVVHKDYGIVHETGYGSFDDKRVYLIASASKILSVGVLMRLADQGKVDLDKPISQYLSAWGNYKTDITLAQMMSNSSGMVGLVDDPLYAPYICQYVDSGAGTLSECAKTIYTADDAKDLKPPDTEFHYGGGQWQLAGGIAEVVSDEKWSDLIKETYIDPCGLDTTGYTNQYTKAYQSGNSVASGLSYPGFFMADVANLPATENPSIEGGAYVTTHDYAEVLLMHLRGGTCGENRVLSEAAVSRMQEDRIAKAYNGSTFDMTLAGYGLGWWIDRENPGVFADTGAYGAMPWLDLPRGYAAFLVLEADAATGTALRQATKPVLDAVFDAL